MLQYTTSYGWCETSLWATCADVRGRVGFHLQRVPRTTFLCQRVSWWQASIITWRSALSGKRVDAEPHSGCRNDFFQLELTRNLE